MITKARIVNFIFLLTNLISLSCAAYDLEQQRQKFMHAQQHLSQGQYEAFQKEMNGLENYPLYPYLQYQDIRRKLVRASSAEVTTFLNAYPDTWFGQDIRQEWLRILAKRQNWAEYLTFYTPTQHAELNCHYLFAVYQVKPDELDTTAIESLWYRGKNLPKACEPVIAIWQQRGGLTEDARINRIKLAIKSHNLALTKELITSLSSSQTQQLQNWLNSPQSLLANRAYNMDTPLIDDMLYYAIQKITENDIEEGIHYWDKISACHALNEQEEGEILSTIAVKLAARNDPRAAEWLDQIPDDFTTKAAREWRIREALRRQDWHAVLKWTALLPADESNEEVWVYWRARAWEKLNATHKARRLYNQIAHVRSYYGFLAAKKLGRKLSLNHKTIKISDDMLSEMANHPGITRAKELYLLGQLGNARREWEFTVAQLPAPQQMAAAKLAYSWAWHDSALMTANKTDLIDDLDIRFPTPHLETVLLESQKRTLDPAIVFSIIRQESAFMADARSYMGAVGLMQVRPESAIDFAVRVWKEPAPSSAQLFKPEYNIRVGSAYFNSLLKEFNGQLAPAIAAYNAGPGRVKKWLPTQEAVSTDEWIETIPYYETREYLQHVLAYLVIYTHHLHDANKLAQNAPELSINQLFSMVTPVPKATATITQARN